MKDTVTVEAIEAAYQRLQSVVTRTPLQFNPRLSEQFGAEIYLKREDLQIVRSYKLRGAYNLMSSLTAGRAAAGRRVRQRRQPRAGRRLHLPPTGDRGAYLHAPEHAAPESPARTQPRRTLDHMELVGDTFDATYRLAAEYRARDTGRSSSTRLTTRASSPARARSAWRLPSRWRPRPISWSSPVGGGGLISGLAVYGERHFPQTTLIGVEPAGAACMLAALAGRTSGHAAAD